MFVNCWTVKPNAEIAQLGGIRIPLAFVHETIAHVIFVTVALIWFVPDRRIEHLKSEL